MKALLIFTLAIGHLGAATTLKDAFVAAKANMETLKRADIVVDQREERQKQAKGAMLPTLSGVGNLTQIDPPNRTGATSAFTLTRQHSAAIRLQQPLLRGGLFSAFEFAREDVLLSQFQRDASELNLYQLVINSYFGLHQAILDNEILNELLRFSRDRVNELRSRTRVGRSRRGELVQAEAQLLAAETQFQSGTMNFQEARRNFEFFTKLAPESLAPLGLMPRELPALSEYLTKLRTRPDILAAEQQVKLAETQVGIAKGGHLPTLDFVGNYFFDRTGVLQSSDWDAALVVSIPLYQGGRVSSQVRESVSRKREVQLNYQETARASERDITILHANYTQVQGQLDTLKKAVEKAEQGYKLNKQDYQYGQVTNLEVIQSMNLYIETKRSYQLLLSNGHRMYRQLEASIGALP